MMTSLEAWCEMVNVPTINCIIGAVSAKKCIDAVASGVSPIVRVKNENLADWELREIDRADYRDWMPYHIRYLGHETRVYYVNVNSSSTAYENYLVLRAGNIAIIDEWDGTGNDPVWRHIAVS